MCRPNANWMDVQAFWSLGVNNLHISKNVEDYYTTFTVDHPRTLVEII